MTLTYSDWKLKLIDELLKLKDEQSLKKIEQELQTLSAAEKAVESEAQKLEAVIKPIKQSISIDEMIKEQAYTPIQKVDFYRKVSKLAIKEPLEELLSMLD